MTRLIFYIFRKFSFQGYPLRASSLLRIFQRNRNPGSLEILHKIETPRPGAGVKVFEKYKNSNFVSKTTHFDPILRADFIFEGFSSFGDILAVICVFVFGGKSYTKLYITFSNNFRNKSHTTTTNPKFVFFHIHKL